MPRRVNAEAVHFKSVSVKQSAGVCCCIIAADEEGRIGRAIESVKDLADEVIVIDTGSRDQTAAAARGAGARIFDFPWRDDFSAARNFALAHSREEWILVLDADEAIERDDPRAIRRLLSSPGVGAFSFEQRTYCDEPTTFGWEAISRDRATSRISQGFFACRQVRLFRKNERVVYRGRIFEEVTSSLQECGVRVIDTGSVIHHYGRLEPRERIYRKTLTYLASTSGRPAIHRWNAHYAFETAVQLFVLGNLLEARGLVTRCLEVVPHCWQFLNLRGLIDLRSQMTDDAIACFERALHVQRDARELYCNLGVAYLENGQPEQALRTVQQGIARSGPDARLLEQAALASRTAGDIDGASDYIDEALATDPHRPGTHAARADILYARGDAAGALRALDALRFLPEVPLGVYLRSLHLCVRMRALEHAGRIVRGAMDEHPGNNTLLLLQGKILELDGNDSGALDFYRRLLAVDPENTGVLACLGCLYERGGDLSNALTAFHSAYRLSPSNSRAEVNLAIVLEKLGRTDEAERHLRNAVGRRPGDGTACNALGCLLARGGMYEESITYFERAVDLEPSSECFRVNLERANRMLASSTVVS